MAKLLGRTQALFMHRPYFSSLSLRYFQLFLPEVRIRSQIFSNLPLRYKHTSCREHIFIQLELVSFVPSSFAHEIKAKLAHEISFFGVTFQVQL